LVADAPGRSGQIETPHIATSTPLTGVEMTRMATSVGVSVTIRVISMRDLSRRFTNLRYLDETKWQSLRMIPSEVAQQ
jgi:hypothetical protein